MIRSRAGRASQPMPGQGASDGVISLCALMACGLAGFGPGDLRAETPEPSAPAELIQRSAEPFGLAAASLSSGGLRDKWLGVQRRLDDEMVQLALCEGDRDG